MKFLYFKLICALTIFAPLQVDGQDSGPIFPNLYDQEALDSLAYYYKPSQVLNYSEARDYLYGKVYSKNDTVECVYSGHKLHLPPHVDPSVHLFQNGSNDGINCEHTYPRSKGANEDNGNAYSDMHHLFPTRSQVNTGRENFPYADIPDQESTHWYFKTEVRNTMPLANINSYSERINGWFEPRESHKGNAARAIFYFYTMYTEEADAADLDFFEIQKETLCKWNMMDPVDDDEIRRTNLIAEKQDGPGNPFILDNTLVDRCYCAGISTSTDLMQEISLKSFHLYPNPVRSNSNIRVESKIDQKVLIKFISLGGMLMSEEKLHLKKGVNSLPITNINKGQIIYQILDTFDNSILDSGILFVL